MSRSLSRTVLTAECTRVPGCALLLGSFVASCSSLMAVSHARMMLVDIFTKRKGCYNAHKACWEQDCDGCSTAVVSQCEDSSLAFAY